MLCPIWKLGFVRSGSRQDFRQFSLPNETLDEFRYAKDKSGQSTGSLIYHLCEQVVGDVASDIGQPEIATGMTIG